MQLIDTWIARLRGKALPKPRQSVLTFDRYELMTATQALRFEELRSTSFNEKFRQPDKQLWYSLDEACDELALDEEALLRAAAQGRVTLFVYSKSGTDNLRIPLPVHGDIPEFLALPIPNCRELAANGTSEVRELHFNESENRQHLLPLKQAKRVNLQTVYLQHPLPDPTRLGL